MWEDNNRRNMIQQVLPLPKDMQTLWTPLGDDDDDSGTRRRKKNRKDNRVTLYTGFNLSEITTDQEMTKFIIAHINSFESNTVTGVSLFILPHSRYFFYNIRQLFISIQRLLTPDVQVEGFTYVFPPKQKQGKKVNKEERI